MTFFYSLSDRPSQARSEQVQILTANVFQDNVTTDSLVQSLHGNGKTVICYFSAGTSEDWRADYKNLSAHVKGRALKGGNGRNGEWAGNKEPERWLNIRDPKVRDSIMVARIVRAGKLCCDGVDPDNVDGYESGNVTGFKLGRNDSIDYLKFLANAAHRTINRCTGKPLLIGLKNSSEIVGDVERYLDFAVTERCVEQKECGAFQPFVKHGKPVFNVEYKNGNSLQANRGVCRDSLSNPNSSYYRFGMLFAPRDQNLDHRSVACTPQSR